MPFEEIFNQIFEFLMSILNQLLSFFGLEL